MQIGKKSDAVLAHEISPRWVVSGLVVSNDIIKALVASTSITLFGSFLVRQPNPIHLRLLPRATLSTSNPPLHTPIPIPFAHSGSLPSPHPPPIAASARSQYPPVALPQNTTHHRCPHPRTTPHTRRLNTCCSSITLRFSDPRLPHLPKSRIPF